MPNTSVIIVENDSAAREQWLRAFEEKGYITWTCPAVETAISLFSNVQPNIVVLDLDMEGGGVLELLDIWKLVSPNTRIIVHTARTDEMGLQEAKRRGADALLAEPFSMTLLFELLEKEPPKSTDLKTTPRAA